MIDLITAINTHFDDGMTGFDAGLFYDIIPPGRLPAARLSGIPGGRLERTLGACAMSSMEIQFSLFVPGLVEAGAKAQQLTGRFDSASLSIGIHKLTFSRIGEPLLLYDSVAGNDHGDHAGKTVFHAIIRYRMKVQRNI